MCFNKFKQENDQDLVQFPKFNYPSFLLDLFRKTFLKFTFQFKNNLDYISMLSDYFSLNLLS